MPSRLREVEFHCHAASFASRARSSLLDGPIDAIRASDCLRHLRRNIPPYINSFRRRYQGGRANDRPGASEEDELAAGAGAADDDELDDGTSASCSEHGVDGADAKEQLHRSFEGEQHEQCIAASREGGGGRGSGGKEKKSSGSTEIRTQDTRFKV